MKEQIVIVSDMWGAQNSAFFNSEMRILAHNYDLTFYDSSVLGDVKIGHLGEESIHQQFVDFGIRNAANKLLTLEKEPKFYIGCSVGGTIIWKAGLLGLPIKNLVAISSTRLRLETEKPNCPLKLFFGELDESKPNLDWFLTLSIAMNIIPGHSHSIYTEKSCMDQIIKDLEINQWINLSK